MELEYGTPVLPRHASLARPYDVCDGSYELPTETFAAQLVSGDYADAGVCCICGEWRTLVAY